MSNLFLEIGMSHLVPVAADDQDCVIVGLTGPTMPGRTDYARQAQRGDRPRKDYVELAEVLGADTVDSEYMGRRASLLARLVARVHYPAGQILEVFLRRRYRRIIAWGDQYGLALALLLKLSRSRRKLVVIGFWLSRPKKAVFLSRLRVDSHIQAILLTSARQREHAAKELGVPPSKLHPYSVSVDERFWTPGEAARERMICSAGVEGRDYATLLEAVRGLDVVVELGVATPTLAGGEALRRCGLDPDNIPANVRLTSPSLRELRSLYARSQFVVIPLRESDYDPGSTVALEAMAMGKAVVMTRTGGQSELIREGETGLRVPPGDVAALRSAIQRLLDNPDEALRMGRAGRQLVEQRHGLDRFIAHVARVAEANWPRESPQSGSSQTDRRAPARSVEPTPAQMPPGN